MMKRPVMRLLGIRAICRAPILSPGTLFPALLFAFAFLMPLAHAGSFAVNPVRVELSASQASAVIQVTNNGTDEVTIEARSLAWTQMNGKDQLTPTREMIVTPQIFRLKPGAQQLLRLGSLRKPDAVQEMSYRLTLEEIPPPPSPDFKGLRVALRISMPVFLKPIADAKEKIDLALALRDPAQLHLRLSNTGTASAQLSEFALSFEDDPDRVIARLLASTYVLPGQQRELLLTPNAIDPARKMRVRAKTATGQMEFHDVSVLR